MKRFATIYHEYANISKFKEIVNPASNTILVLTGTRPGLSNRTLAKLYAANYHMNPSSEPLAVIRANSIGLQGSFIRSVIASAGPKPELTIIHTASIHPELVDEVSDITSLTLLPFRDVFRGGVTQESKQHRVKAELGGKWEVDQEIQARVSELYPNLPSTYTLRIQLPLRYQAIGNKVKADQIMAFLDSVA